MSEIDERIIRVYDLAERYGIAERDVCYSETGLDADDCFRDLMVYVKSLVSSITELEEKEADRASSMHAIMTILDVDNKISETDDIYQAVHELAYELRARIAELEARWASDFQRLTVRIAELEATVKGHNPFEEYPPKQRGFECSVVVLGKFEYEDEFTPITNWDLCVYWFDDERWHPLNGYVAGDDIVRWYALPSEVQE